MNSHQLYGSRKGLQCVWSATLFPLLLVLLGFVFVNSATAVSLPPTNTPLESGCPGFPTTVVDEAALNSTITCFNNLTTAGHYTLTLTANITLTASTTSINNSTAGVELHIAGSGHTVDG